MSPRLGAQSRDFFSSASYVDFSAAASCWLGEGRMRLALRWLENLKPYHRHCGWCCCLWVGEGKQGEEAQACGIS